MVKAEPELKPPKFKPKPSKKRNRGYGPLQNFYAHLPRWFCTLESIVIHCFHAVACMTLLLVVAVEHRRLHVFGYLIDAFYAVVVTVADFLWLMDVNVGWGVWTSLAAYQSTICAVLYVGDWRRKKNSPVPPIFPFLTYDHGTRADWRPPFALLHTHCCVFSCSGITFFGEYEIGSM
eukprot:GEMP01058535.1.p1 GENE.GEMP01058535.1~~GEMP01058535.1.p1  ORF type:complete len:177 (+),score=22.27 GEMP01058535.1:192-722(+)